MDDRCSPALERDAPSAPPRASFGVAIPCHNEAHNIAPLLRAVVGAFPAARRPSRIHVLSSGSWDGTDDIVAAFARECSIPIVLVVEPHRSGKPSAVNQLIRKMADLDTIVLISGDVLPAPQCLENLLAAMENGEVGIAGGRPMPEGPPDRPAVRITGLLWEMHHRIASRFPKTTEVTVFRNIVGPIPEEALCDEAELESLLTDAGYRVAYVPEAVIRTQSPLTLRDYISRRFSVTIGHMMLAQRRGYRVGTLRVGERLRALWAVARHGRAFAGTILLAAMIEGPIYALAWLKTQRNGKIGPCWNQSRSSKRPFEDEGARSGEYRDP
jgi:poly-beta-1,6-N-acetyl-D-glucosamine synthase